MPSSKFLSTTGGGPASGQELFTATGTFTVPAGVTSINVCCIGKGGNGAATVDAYYGAPHSTSFPVPGGGGGGGGMCYKNSIAVTPAEDCDITINGSFSQFNQTAGSQLNGYVGANASGINAGAGGIPDSGDVNRTGGAGASGGGTAPGGGGTPGSWTGTGALGNVLAAASSGGKLLRCSRWRRNGY